MREYVIGVVYSRVELIFDTAVIRARDLMEAQGIAREYCYGVNRLFNLYERTAEGLSEAIR